jgi:hypothetical protein
VCVCVCARQREVLEAFQGAQFAGLPNVEVCVCVCVCVCVKMEGRGRRWRLAPACG